MNFLRRLTRKKDACGDDPPPPGKPGPPPAAPPPAERRPSVRPAAKATLPVDPGAPQRLSPPPPKPRPLDRTPSQVTVLMAVVRLQAIRRGALGRRRARLIREEMVYEEDLEESRELKRVLITEEVLKHDEDSDEDDAADIDTAELAYRLRLQRRAAHIQQTLLGTMRLVLGECVARPRLAVEETAAWEALERWQVEALEETSRVGQCCLFAMERRAQLTLFLDAQLEMRTRGLRLVEATEWRRLWESMALVGAETEARGALRAAAEAAWLALASAQDAARASAVQLGAQCADCGLAEGGGRRAMEAAEALGREEIVARNICNLQREHLWWALSSQTRLLLRETALRQALAGDYWRGLPRWAVERQELDHRGGLVHHSQLEWEAVAWEAQRAASEQRTRGFGLQEAAVRRWLEGEERTCREERSRRAELEMARILWHGTLLAQAGLVVEETQQREAVGRESTARLSLWAVEWEEMGGRCRIALPQQQEWSAASDSWLASVRRLPPSLVDGSIGPETTQAPAAPPHRRCTKKAKPGVASLCDATPAGSAVDQLPPKSSTPPSDTESSGKPNQPSPVPRVRRVGVGRRGTPPDAFDAAAQQVIRLHPAGLRVAGGGDRVAPGEPPNAALRTGRDAAPAPVPSSSPLGHGFSRRSRGPVGVGEKEGGPPLVPKPDWGGPRTSAPRAPGSPTFRKWSPGSTQDMVSSLQFDNPPSLSSTLSFASKSSQFSISSNCGRLGIFADLSQAYDDILAGRDGGGDGSLSNTQLSGDLSRRSKSSFLSGSLTDDLLETLVNRRDKWGLSPATQGSDKVSTISLSPLPARTNSGPLASVEPLGRFRHGPLQDSCGGLTPAEPTSPCSGDVNWPDRQASSPLPARGKCRSPPLRPPLFPERGTPPLPSTPESDTPLVGSFHGRPPGAPPPLPAKAHLHNDATLGDLQATLQEREQELEKHRHKELAFFQASQQRRQPEPATLLSDPNWLRTNPQGKRRMRVLQPLLRDPGSSLGEP